jgi:hypothetical protein
MVEVDLDLALSQFSPPIEPIIHVPSADGGGFGDFLRGGAFSDWTLKVESLGLDEEYEDVGAAEFKVHRIVLASKSGYFERLLLSERFRASADFERAQTTLPVPCAAMMDAVPQALSFIYGAPVSITPENVVPLMALADMLLVPALVHECRK